MNITTLPILIFFLVVICFSIYTVYSYRRFEIIFNILGHMIRKISHLYSLSGILQDGLCSPLHKHIYETIYNLGPDSVCFKFESFKKDLSDFFQRSLETIKKEKEDISDPDKIMNIGKRETEIMNALNLLDTLDEKSSEEQIQLIMQELNISLINLNSLIKY